MNKVDKLVERVGNLNGIVERYEAFLEKATDPGTVKQINIQIEALLISINKLEEEIGDIIAGEDHEEDTGRVISISLPLRFHDPSIYSTINTGLKYDSEKTDWSLLPMDVIEEVAEVLTFGAKKYAPDNWKRVPKWRDRYYSAAQRHIKQYRDGEFNDLETDRSHLAHAIACLVFLYEKEKEGSES